MRLPVFSRRRLLLTALAATLGFGALIGATSSALGLGNTQPERFGLAIKEVLGRSGDGATVAVVNGSSISQRQLDVEIVTRQFNGQPSDRASALDSLITEEVILSEAARQGITVSDNELNAVVQSQRQLADQDPDRHFYGYAAGLGQTDATIWSYRPLLDEWRRHMVIGKLKHSVLGDVTQKTLDAKEADWAAYVAGLRAKATVVVK